MIESTLTEAQQGDILDALVQRRYYSPGSPFHHEPTFEGCEDPKYLCIVEIVKWNTRSTRINRFHVRFDSKKDKYIFAKKPGQTRIPHGEKMR